MIGGQTDKNPKLSFEQLESLATYQAQVSNFQHEISIAAQTLASTRLELESVEKNLAYQQGIFGNLTDDIRQLDSAKEVLASDIAAATQEHAETVRKSRELAEHASVKEAELAEREQALAEREEEYKQKMIDLTSQYTALAGEREAVDAAKAAFSKALDAVTW